ncbi:GNAT family N-acetyltransferase [Acaryochloris sp. IP29b_bin.148]|uniref:GNAT family N-acetyltransferase n=1 Tax=Acaryochloris sp. IP29b_bin.148 TaxID=2969218 RepID=UPI00262F5871|nr:GNAT family N-acetyltransferase [Acaryochloris sp. IP29b_bin.148]
MDNRHIQFRDGLTEPGQQVTTTELLKLQRLFQVGAFWAGERCLEDWAVAIANSHPIISVWDREALIGFARATSDGIYRAMVWDVVIHPDYRGQGLGRQLVQTLLAHPHMNRVERIYLTTTHQQSFYEHIGFVSNSSTTMVLNQQSAAAISSPDGVQSELWSEQLLSDQSEI